MTKLAEHGCKNSLPAVYVCVYMCMCARVRARVRARAYTTHCSIRVTNQPHAQTYDTSRCPNRAPDQINTLVPRRPRRRQLNNIFPIPNVGRTLTDNSTNRISMPNQIIDTRARRRNVVGRVLADT